VLLSLRVVRFVKRAAVFRYFRARVCVRGGAICVRVCVCVCVVALFSCACACVWWRRVFFACNLCAFFPPAVVFPFSGACCAFLLFRAKRGRTHACCDRTPGPFAGASPAAGWSFLLRVLRPLRVRLPFLSFFPDRPAHLRVLRPPRGGHSSCGCFARCAFGCDRSPGPFAGASPAARTFTLALHCFINIHF